MTTLKKIKAGIIGAASLTAEVLIKHLVKHKFVEISILVSENFAGKKIQNIFPQFKNIVDITFSEYLPEKIIKECDVIFLCKGGGEGIEKTAQLYNLANNKDTKFIDLSCDFRLKDISLYKKWYNFEHKFPEITKDAVYGLPEIKLNQIKKAKIVANPGCYPTSVILGVAPLFEENIIDKKYIVVDAHSGISGAGRTLQERSHSLQVLENIFVYKVGSHPHIPEIEQELSLLAKNKIKITFLPHIASFKYGMMTTVYTKCKKKISWDDLFGLYSKFYGNKSFVRLYCEDTYPEVQNVVGTNFCDIGFKIDERTGNLIIISCIDNLMKGASGQAIQNMNIMFGFDEKEGLL